jgi:predicted GTPase
MTKKARTGIIEEKLQTMLLNKSSRDLIIMGRNQQEGKSCLVNHLFNSQSAPYFSRGQETLIRKNNGLVIEREMRG